MPFLGSWADFSACFPPVRFWEPEIFIYLKHSLFKSRLVEIFPIQLSQKLYGFAMYDSSQLHVPNALPTVVLETCFFLDISAGTLHVLVICES